MKKIAHRGYKTNYIKENTLEAFQNAVNNDFVGIEFDVHTTKDNELVVIHDYMIDRVSDGSGFVFEKTYDELLHFNFGSDIVPSKIPLLREVLEKFKGIVKLVELKGHVDISSIVDLADENTYFMSFDNGYIEILRDKYPYLKFGVLNYILNNEGDYNMDMICLLDNFANDEIVDYYLNKGIKVFIYGIIGDINYKRDDDKVFYITNKKN